MDNNTNQGTSAIKATTVVTAVELKTEVAGVFTTKTSAKSDGTYSQDFGLKGSVRIYGIPVNLAGSAGVNSSGQISTSGQASVGMKNKFEILVKAKGTSENITLGAGVSTKTDNSKSTYIFGFKFY